MATVLKETTTKVDKDEKADVKEVSQDFVNFLKEVRAEFLKISWPSKDQVTKEFLSVVLLVAVLTGAIFVIDKGLEVIVNFFMGRLFL